MNDSYESGYMPTPIEAMRIYWKKRVRRRFCVLTALFLVMVLCCASYYYTEFRDARNTLADYDSISAAVLYTAAAEESKDSSMNEKAQKPAVKQTPVQAEAPEQTEAPAQEEEQAWTMENHFSKAHPFARYEGKWLAPPEKMFFNNLTACMIIVMLGMVPFLPLSVLALPVNAALMAAGIIALSWRGDSIVPGLCGMLPHGIPKAAALVLSAALGSLLSREIRRRIMRRPDARPMHALGMTVMLFVVAVIPLLLATAAVEFWLSPEIYRWAMMGGLGI